MILKKTLERLPRTIGVLGAGGKLGGATVKGLKRHPEFRSDILISGRDQDKLRPLQQEFGAIPVSNEELAKYSDAVLVFAKPKDVPEALRQIRPTLHRRALVLPFAAALTPKDIALHLGSGEQVVCGMTSLAVELGAGVTFLCAHPEAPEQHRLLAAHLSHFLGDVIWLDDADSHTLHLATAIAGCLPAYYAFVLNAVQKKAAELGISDPAVSEKVALSTMLGTAKLMMANGLTAAQLIANVATPNGVTEGGIKKLVAAGVEETFGQVIAGNVTRCEEIALSLTADAKVAGFPTFITTLPSSHFFKPPQGRKLLLESPPEKQEEKEQGKLEEISEGSLTPVYQS